MPKYRIISGTTYEVEAATLEHAKWQFHRFIDGTELTSVKESCYDTDYALMLDDADIEAAMDDFDKSLAGES